nr:hypothetical protein [Tanacetum cinerariifolium]
MSKDPSIPRRNKVNWHYVRDDHMFSTIKLVSRHQNTQQFGALLPIELTNEEIRKSNAYKEYYAIAIGAAPPKPKASARRTRSSSDTSITPPTTAANDDGEEGNDDDDDDQQVERDDDKDDEEEGGDDDQEFDKEEYAEETRDEESFYPILRTPENANDEGNGDEDLRLHVGGEEGHIEEEKEDELYRDVNINQGRGLQTTLEVEDSHVTLTPVSPDAEVLTRSSHSSKTSYAVAADLSEMELKKILIEKIEGNKETVTLKRRQDDDADKDEEPSAGPDRGSKRRREGNEPESASAPIKTTTRRTGRSTQGFRSRQALASESVLTEEPIIQPWISELAKKSDSRSSFNELIDTPLDFFNFLINRLKVDTLTPKLLADPTYELMKRSCKSLVELKYHLEEVFKATTDQLDWVNSEGQQYPHNLLKPLPLIPNNRGRRVIPFEHFINNDLEYLRGGASSRKYTTSITKMKAADYGHIKWIKDLVPRTMWIKEPIGYDKHAL